MSLSMRVEGVRVARGVSAVITAVPLYQVNEGGGDPDASHRNVADCPIDTEIVAGVTGVPEGEKHIVYS